MPLNVPRRLLPVLGCLIATACLVPPAALADGGQSIATAPAIAFGQQEFGNTATGATNDADGCQKHFRWVALDSYWTLAATAGDRVTVNWESQAGDTNLYVYPAGTTDFNLGNTEPVQSQALAANGKNQLVFSAQASGTLPVLFQGNCSADAAGPYDFTAFVRHVVRLALPHVSKLKRTATLKVAAHTADGGSITDSSLVVDVQAKVGKQWRRVGTAAVANSVASVRVTLPARLQGQRVSLRASAHGGAYLSATTRSLTVLVASPAKPRKVKRGQAALRARLARKPSRRIVVGQGMAGIRLGDSQARVRRVLGKPSTQNPPDYQGNSSWGYPKSVGGLVGFDSKLHVNDIWTGSAKLKTDKGIAVGASVAKVRKAYPKAHCFTSKGLKWSLVCELKSRYKGRHVVTMFSFAGTLSEIEIDFG